MTRVRTGLAATGRKALVAMMVGLLCAGPVNLVPAQAQSPATAPQEEPAVAGALTLVKGEAVTDAVRRSAVVTRLG